MKILGICLLSLLWPALCAAATSPSPYPTAAGKTIGDAPLEPGKPKLQPMPAPMPSSHYARQRTEPGARPT